MTQILKRLEVQLVRTESIFARLRRWWLAWQTKRKEKTIEKK